MRRLFGLPFVSLGGERRTMQEHAEWMSLNVVKISQDVGSDARPNSSNAGVLNSSTAGVCDTSRDDFFNMCTSPVNEVSPRDNPGHSRTTQAIFHKAPFCLFFNMCTSLVNEVSPPRGREGCHEEKKRAVQSKTKEAGGETAVGEKRSRIVEGWGGSIGRRCLK